MTALTRMRYCAEAWDIQAIAILERVTLNAVSNRCWVRWLLIRCWQASKHPTHLLTRLPALLTSTNWLVGLSVSLQHSALRATAVQPHRAPDRLSRQATLAAGLEPAAPGITGNHPANQHERYWGTEATEYAIDADETRCTRRDGAVCASCLTRETHGKPQIVVVRVETKNLWTDSDLVVVVAWWYVGRFFRGPYH